MCQPGYVIVAVAGTTSAMLATQTPQHTILEHVLHHLQNKVFYGRVRDRILHRYLTMEVDITKQQEVRSHLRWYCNSTGFCQNCH